MSPIGWDRTREVPVRDDWRVVRPAPIITPWRRAIANLMGARSRAALAWTRRAIAQVALSNRYGYTQPIGRRGIGVLVVGLWLTGVGMLAHQQFARTDADRLAEAAMTVSPTQYYYEVFQDTAHIGVALSGMDTTDHQFVATTLFKVAMEPGDVWAEPTVTERDTGMAIPSPRRRPESMARTVGYLSRGFVLDSIDVAVNGFERPSYTQRYPIPPGVTVLSPTLAPMALMMVHGAQVGTSASYGLIDPERGTTVHATLRVVAESLFTIADSARYDSTASAWVPAHVDTVRAWRVIQPHHAAAPGQVATLAHAPRPGSSAAMLPLSLFDCTTGASLWVDAHGRIVAADDAAGRHAMRTTYEIAFGNWRHRQR